MPNYTTKTHKSRKTASESSKPRKQRKPSKGSAPAGSSSSILPATTALTLPDNPVGAILAPSADDKKNEATGVILPPIEGDPKRQSWYRAPDSKTRKVFDKIVVMDVAGHPDKEIARRLKTSEGTVRFTRFIGKKNGWANENDEPTDIEAELAMDIDRKVVRNISVALDGGMTNYQTHEMTLAAAKGRGMFKNHDVVKQDGNPGMSVVAIKVVMPAIGAGDQMPQIGEDQMGGVPAYIEGEFNVVGDEGVRPNQADAAPVQPEPGQLQGSGAVAEPALTR